MAQWAWRLPFLLGLLIGVVAWLVRRRIPETQLFHESIRIPDTYLDFYREYCKHLRPTAIIVGLILSGVVLTYLIYVFSVTYMSSMLQQYAQQQALSINMLSIIFLVLLMPWMGKLGDYIGRRPLMAFALIGSMLWVWAYFWLLQQQGIVLALLAQLIMTIFMAAYWAV